MSAVGFFHDLQNLRQVADGPLRFNGRILGRTVLHQPGDLKSLAGGAINVSLRVISNIETLLGRSEPALSVKQNIVSNC